MLKGEKIYLRQLEEHDITALLLWENNAENWRYSATEAPFSMYEIGEYIKTASLIRQNLQIRLIICLTANDQPIGTVDLFTIDFKNGRAGVGILIAEKANRQKGYALEALNIMAKFAAEQLELSQLHCEIQADNQASIQLFERAGFVRNGTKKDWFKIKNEIIDAYFYQKFL